MTSKTVVLLPSDLRITKTHSRPHVSNNNPFSWAQFKTLKYRPQIPQRLGTLADTKAFCRSFFRWYNTEHRHSGIALTTPQDAHYGWATQILETRTTALDAAFEVHPERFNGKRLTPKPLLEAVWNNPSIDQPAGTQDVV